MISTSFLNFIYGLCLFCCTYVVFCCSKLIFWVVSYHTHIKFHGLNFRAIGWQENSWGINFCGHGGVVATIVVGINFCGV